MFKIVEVLYFIYAIFYEWDNYLQLMCIAAWQEINFFPLG